MTIRVAIIEPRRLMGQLLHHLLSAQPDMLVAGVYKDVAGLLSAMAESEVDVVLYTVLPGSPAVHAEFVRRVRALSPSTHIVAMVGDRQEHLLRVLTRAGVTGHTSERAEAADVVRAIRAAGEGTPSISQDLVLQLLDEYAAPKPPSIELTPRERSILQFICEGHNNREIAGRLGLSEKTVKNHVTNIFTKLGVRDRTQAAIYALQVGLVEDPALIVEESKPLLNVIA